ncbi:MAG: c-type cytochrome, partial [Acidobacteriota bacterium]|nr:c-type cytochrome [Acidobacteriota bacterium]
MVQPFVAKSCFGCHSDKLQSGGLNLQALAKAEAVAKDRAEWEKVLEKLRTGQMPPAGMPRPADADLKAVTAWISEEFDRQDRSAAPDPG